MKPVKISELSNATRKRNPNLFASQAPHLERPISHEQVAEKKSPRFSAPIRQSVYISWERLVGLGWDGEYYLWLIGARAKPFSRNKQKG